MVLLHIHQQISYDSHRSTLLLGSMRKVLSIIGSSVVGQCLTCGEHDRARTTPGTRARASRSQTGTLDALDSSVLYVCHSACTKYGSCVQKLRMGVRATT
jgi:hypothetical protein